MSSTSSLLCLTLHEGLQWDPCCEIGRASNNIANLLALNVDCNRHFIVLAAAINNGSSHTTLECQTHLGCTLCTLSQIIEVHCPEKVSPSGQKQCGIWYLNPPFQWLQFQTASLWCRVWSCTWLHDCMINCWKVASCPCHTHQCLLTSF